MLIVKVIDGQRQTDACRVMNIFSTIFISLSLPSFTESDSVLISWDNATDSEPDECLIKKPVIVITGICIQENEDT